MWEQKQAIRGLTRFSSTGLAGGRQGVLFGAVSQDTGLFEGRPRPQMLQVDCAFWAEGSSGWSSGHSPVL